MAKVMMSNAPSFRSFVNFLCKISKYFSKKKKERRKKKEEKGLMGF